MSIDLIMIAIVLGAISGLPGLCLSRSSAWGQWIAMGIMAAGMVTGLTGAYLGLNVDQQTISNFPWSAAGNSVVGVDALSAFFLAPIFLMGGLGSIYGLGYWPQSRHQGNGKKLRAFWGLLVAGMSLLVISQHAMAFLLGWEVMALSAFFLVSAEDYRGDCRQAGWIYLIAAHVSTLTLFALFALWRWATGSYALHPVADDTIGLGVMNGLFFLALVVFGLKAGIMPLHFWLPGAHANAPSHVSAMLSAVVLKMGIYGLVRFTSLLPDPPAAWGGLILVLGAISGVLGVVFAIGQHDLKRLLAYHSVENIGIIMMGLGLAMLGQSFGQPTWVALGLGGCLLHVWNHSLFKSLLFLCAGSVVHATHTREIDHLGGLAKSMPWTAAMFLIGAVAICGLPPLNGFISELLVYLGAIQTIAPDAAHGSIAVLAVPVLALIGALSVACFVKVYGAVFLGSPRTRTATHAHEASITMTAPMAVLACFCVLIGVAPLLVSPILDAAIAIWAPHLPSGSVKLSNLAPLQMISVMALSVAGLVAGLVFLLGSRIRTQPSANTWDCGYARPTRRMQYTASSFANTIIGLFRWVLRPHVRRPSVQGLFPAPTRTYSHVDDAVLDRLLVPAGQEVERRFNWFHRFQQGLTQHYMLYILITVIVMLSTLIPINEFFARWFAR